MTCQTCLPTSHAGRKDVFVHASRRAPRCLPCNYTDPLEESGIAEQLNLFHAIKACPCTLDAMCKGAHNPHIINPWDCKFSKFRPAWWYFVHGGVPQPRLLTLLLAAGFAQALLASLLTVPACQPCFSHYKKASLLACWS